MQIYIYILWIKQKKLVEFFYKHCNVSFPNNSLNEVQV